jgi:hypothetical protein
MDDGAVVALQGGSSRQLGEGGIMRCERTLVGVCLTGLMFSACASGAQVAATGPDQASDATAAYDVAEAAPRAEQRPSPPAPNTPPVFPPNYRSRIALELTGEYVAKSKGPPVITEPRMRPITYQGARVSVCVGFPIAILYGLVDGTRMRRWVIFAIPESGSPGRHSFHKRELGNLDRCEDEGEMKPFTELMQFGDKLKACHARGESRCTVSDGPTGRNTVVMPPPSR